MSYILEALRKSEQQRQRARMPLLYTAQLSGETEKSSSFLVYGVVGAILVCAGILIGWLRPWLHSAPPKGEEIARSLPEMHARSLPHPVPAPVPSNLQAATANMAVPKAPSSRPIDKLPPRVAGTNVGPAREKAAAVDEMEHPARNQAIVSIGELPPSIRQEIPKMSVSGYIDSVDPKDRTVGINGRLLQEGDYLAQGIRLEQISANGLVFSYKQYRFRQGLN